MSKVHNLSLGILEIKVSHAPHTPIECWFLPSRKAAIFKKHKQGLPDLQDLATSRFQIRMRDAVVRESRIREANVRHRLWFSYLDRICTRHANVRVLLHRGSVVLLQRCAVYILSEHLIKFASE
jgi:hypothetical protein